MADNRQSKFQLSEGVPYGGIFNEKQIQELQAKIMKIYDIDNDGIIQNLEVSQMMSDAYRAMNKNFKPTATDNVQYTRTITRRTDSRGISGQDIKNVCERLFLQEQQ